MYLLIGDSGTVQFSGDATVTSEKVSMSTKPTSNPIEGGGTINDHANNDPKKVSVVGVASSSAGRDTLERMRDNRDLIAYRGIEAYDNLLITDLSISRDADNSGGYKFTVSLQQMDITSAAYVPIGGPSMSQQDANTKKSNSKSTKKKTENGLVTPSTDYASYVNSFSGSNTNTGVGNGRSNPSNPGYGG